MVATGECYWCAGPTEGIICWDCFNILRHELCQRIDDMLRGKESIWNTNYQGIVDTIGPTGSVSTTGKSTLNAGAQSPATGTANRSASTRHQPVGATVC
jgi:hypothetical protein